MADTTKTSHANPLPPNAAPIDDVDRVRSRLENLGLEWVAACELAGVSRSTAFRLMRGAGSLASLRRLEDWVVREEARKPPPSATKTAQNKQAEWAALGAAMAEFDPGRFDSMLDGLRDFVKAKRDESAALLKMLHPATKR